VLGQLGGVATPDVADGWLTVSDDLSPEAQRYRLVTDGDETLGRCASCASSRMPSGRWRSPMDDLAGWLLERIAEDERIANAAGDDPVDSEHQANWTPARVLAECDAKRQIIELHGAVDANDPDSCRECSDSGWAGAVDGHSPVDRPCPTLRLLALPYADRPGYREEWA
jgi:hypothetical protein